MALPAHGKTGKLINLVNPEKAQALLGNEAKNAKKVELNERQVCDLELILNGGFSPLESFMNEADYNNVIAKYRLHDGTLFGMPVTLDTDDEDIKVGDYLLLSYEKFGGDIAVMKVEEKYQPDRKVESQGVYNSLDLEHPSVFHLLTEKKKYNISGQITGIKLPVRSWVVCKTPEELRKQFEGRQLAAFQCRNPIHRAHASMFTEVARSHNCAMVVHPIVGPTKSDDFSGIVRKDTYEALRPILPDVYFEYLPYNMMVGGPRECLQHLLIRKNYGFSKMIVGRDHAGCKNKAGVDYYGPYDAQEFVAPLQAELGVGIIPFMQMVYIPEKQGYHSAELAKQNGWNLANISGTEFRGRIMRGEEVPEWFAFPEVVAILRGHYGPKNGVAQPESAVPQIA